MIKKYEKIIFMLTFIKTVNIEFILSYKHNILHTKNVI